MFSIVFIQFKAKKHLIFVFLQTFYAVCAFIVWIAFRRKEDYEAIKVELGRYVLPT